MKYLELSYLVVDNEVFTSREEIGKQIDAVNQKVKDAEAALAQARLDAVKELESIQAQADEVKALHASQKAICYQQFDDDNVLIGYVDAKGNPLKFVGTTEMTPTTGEYLTKI